MAIATINPATGETVRTYDAASAEDVERSVARAAAAYREWRRVPPADRAAVVRRAGEILDRRKDKYAAMMTVEMGKLIGAAREEAAKCAAACRFYADEAARMLADLPVIDSDQERGFVAYEPLGPVLAVMPWNFPFWQVIRFAAPALCAGNVGLLKHASNVPACALALEELFCEAGAPDGVFRTLLVGSDAVPALIADERVAAVTLTGSEPAGRSVGAAAGRALKPSVLELGGSDPFVVLASADVERAASVAVTARTINNGQSCIAAKRFIVADAVYDEFIERFVAGMRALRAGDPADPATTLGPLATPQIVDDLAKQVDASVRMGARLLLGGHRIAGRGNFFEATVLADVPHDSPAAREELFGAAAAVFRVHDTDEAIRVANETSFGLAASAWTRDDAEAERVGRELEAGSVFVNAMVSSDVRFPFGGVKRSGHGRELSDVGMREFMNVKTIRIARGGGGAHSGTE